ncbi:MAG: hypothetical protein MJZ81_09450, partial [Bacteroidales bacterium]|nr:hypothetical protein [Bacteroidales bacterium]
IPGIKKAFVNFLIETLFALFKSFLHSDLISKLMDAPFRNVDAIRFIAPKSKFFSDGNLWKSIAKTSPKGAEIEKKSYLCREIRRKNGTGICLVSKHHNNKPTLKP